MSEVKRYTDVSDDGWLQSPTGEFVSATDYDALAAQLATANERLREAERLLPEAMKWMNEAVGDSWRVHDKVNPPLFEAIDTWLAGSAPEGQS